ncbi:MAG: type I methionyl aminopeptidase [Kiritimatiellia bacterium]
MIVVKRAFELEAMRASCHLAAVVRDKVKASVSPGVTTGELADYAGDLISGEGASCAFLGYHGFPGKICISVNDEVVHGIPGSRVLAIGDVVSLDFGVLLDGFYGDTATTVLVGVTDPELIRMVRVTEKSLYDGLAQAQEGGRLSDISHAIQKTVEGAGFSVVRDFVGHGIGRALHEDPQIPNYGRAGRGPILRRGMTLAIEPMVNKGRASTRVLADGWTVVARDGKPSAHFEHTIAIGGDGVEILTKG